MSTLTRVALTERDEELLVSLFKYRYLSTGQVRRLYFPSDQTATRRLRLLAGAGYVTVFRPRASSTALAMLDRAGAECVAGRLGCTLNDLRWTRLRDKPKDPLYLEHFLEASDFRITLTQACLAGGPVRLLGFLPEHLVEPTPKGAMQRYIRDVVTDVASPRHKISHAPDGVFALERAGRAALFFLEIDRGTEVLSDPDRGVLKMVRFYMSMLESSAYQRYRADFGVSEPFSAFRVLIVTASSARLRNIRQRCATTASEPSARFLWLTTSSATHDEKLLERVWQSLDERDSTPYRLVPQA